MRWALSWGLYWAGDAISRLLALVPDLDYLLWEWAAGALYRPYNRLMVWSSQVQGETDQGPWEKPCTKCKGWGIQDPHTYRVSPCPVCGVGKHTNLKERDNGIHS